MAKAIKLQSIITLFYFPGGDLVRRIQCRLCKATFDRDLESESYGAILAATKLHFSLFHDIAILSFDCDDPKCRRKH